MSTRYRQSDRRIKELQEAGSLRLLPARLDAVSIAGTAADETLKPHAAGAGLLPERKMMQLVSATKQQHATERPGSSGGIIPVQQLQQPARSSSSSRGPTHRHHYRARRQCRDRADHSSVAALAAAASKSKGTAITIAPCRALLQLLPATLLAEGRRGVKRNECAISSTGRRTTTTRTIKGSGSYPLVG